MAMMKSSVDNASLSHAVFHCEAGVAVSYFTCEVVVEALDDADKLFWNSICVEYSPKRVSVDAVERLLKAYEEDIQLPLPFCTLFDDNP